MAAALVGQAFLSASVQTLIERITSSEFRDFLKNRKLNISLLDELRRTLLMLNAVLNDAEEKQITDPFVKEWLDELKDAVFDAEDLLDEINTQSLRCQVEQDSQNVANQVRSFLSFTFSPFYRVLNSKLEAISQKLKCFENQIRSLGLQSFTARVHKTPTTSVINESVVVGREDDKEKLLDMLLSDEDKKGNGIGVITILGMGGLGKTALAQLLYNDKKVKKQFDLKAWACVSEDFDIFRVTKNLLQSISKNKDFNSNNLDSLRVELKRSLSNKKFLFVLDDLWNESYNDWDDLITPFIGGKRGSKIIVTTRQKRVAERTRTFPIHKLTLLSAEYCWCLLAKHAFGNEDTRKYPELEEIGKQIAEKCSGLPLAAKTLGGLLRSKVEKEEWNRILNSNLWELTHDDVMPALRLSYLYLPSQLKKCFAYCSIFPKDYLLDRKKLVLLWMAEGFVQQYSHGLKTMELAANDYFDELLSRSLIQQYEGDLEGMFVMHDLINDLARVVSGKSCTSFEGNDVPNNVRHLSYLQTKYDGSKKFESFYELTCLRTFLPRIPNSWPQYLTRKVPHDFLPRLKCLRVLSLSHYGNITELPNSIGNLVHLRYLDLSWTGIEKLADAIFTLYNLQTLILSWCQHFIELPPQIGNLINLRYLDINHTRLKEMPTQISMLHNLQTLILSRCQTSIELPSKIGNLTHLRHLDVSNTILKEMPPQISMLHNLCSLSTFVVGKQQDGLRVKELKKLPHLQGKLSILKLQNVVDSMDAFEADLKSKGIEELVLEWGRDTDDSQIAKDVLDKLQPSTNLRKLTIKYYGGTSFPNWVGDSSFSKITFLCISDCNNCLSLPPFGQLPYLKELSIKGMKLVQTIGYEFYGNEVDSSSFQLFPYLERLEFNNMPNWEEWLPFEGEGTKLPFPCLKRLLLTKCPKLKGDLPNHLPSLTEVDISECSQLEEKSSTLHWITSIKELTLTEWGFDNDSQSSLAGLRIEKCDSLQFLLRMILGSNCLQVLYLSGIQSLMSFPTVGLPTSLQSLQIYNCKKLEFLPQEAWKNYRSLKFLKITSCHSLTSFPLDCFPGIRSLTISYCHNLESFTQVGGFALNLVDFEVMQCERVKSMSEVQLDTLTALRSLTLFGLPNLESLPQCRSPSNLESISVSGCKGLSSMATAGWGFLRLISLSWCGVGGDDIVHNLLKEQLLPTSLVSLNIWGLDNTKLLEGKGLRHLTSLEELCISICPNLESLPEEELPPSLLLLSIDRCPILKERYRDQRGKHWSKIAHIPAIKINEEVIIA